MNQLDFNKLGTRYLEYWAGKNTGRPLLALSVPAPNGTQPPAPPQSNRERWLDFDGTIAGFRHGLSNQIMMGDTFPLLNPNLGPDILGATLGCELEFGESTTWAVPNCSDITQLGDLALDTSNKWWQQIYDLTERAVKDANGEYAVGITDLHAGLDGLASLISPAEVCYAIADSPELIEKYTWQIFESFKDIVTRLHNLTAPNQNGGSANWIGAYHPGRWYVTSCDMICMLSTPDFRRFVLPELIAELDFLDASVFHLDGPDALRHLDDLLQLKRLNGIQWVPGAGAAPAREWIPVLKRIQDAGKIIHMTIEPEDYPILFEALHPQGVMYNCYGLSEEQANEMLKMEK